MTASSMHRPTTRARGRVARLIGLPAAAAVALGASLLGGASASAAPGTEGVLLDPYYLPAQITELHAPSSRPVGQNIQNGTSILLTRDVGQLVVTALTTDPTSVINGWLASADDHTTYPPPAVSETVIGVVDPVASTDRTIDGQPAYPITFTFPDTWVPEGARVLPYFQPLSGDVTLGEYAGMDGTLTWYVPYALPATPTDWLSYLEQVDGLIVGMPCVIGEPMTVDLPEAVEGLTASSAWNAETKQLEVTLTSDDGYTLAAGDAENFRLNYQFASQEDPETTLDVSEETVTFAYYCGEDGSTDGGTDVTAPDGGEDATADGSTEGGQDVIVATDPAQDEPELAATGSETQPLTLGAAALLLSGAGVLLLSRRIGKHDA